MEKYIEKYEIFKSYPSAIKIMIKKNTDIAVVGAGGMGALFGAILSENGLDCDSKGRSASL